MGAKGYTDTRLPGGMPRPRRDTSAGRPHHPEYRDHTHAKAVPAQDQLFTPKDFASETCHGTETEKKNIPTRVEMQRLPHSEPHRLAARIAFRLRRQQHPVVHVVPQVQVVVWRDGGLKFFQIASEVSSDFIQ